MYNTLHSLQLIKTNQVIHVGYNNNCVKKTAQLIVTNC